MRDDSLILTPKIKPALKVVPRLSILSTSITEFLRAFGVGNNCLESVRKGVYQKQIIEVFNVYYYSKGNLCAAIHLHIDWEKYQFYLSSDSGREFHIEEGKSLLEQLDDASKVIIQHVNKVRRDLCIDSIEVKYTYRECYRNDEEKYNEARKFLGHIVAESTPKLSSRKFSTSIEFIMEKLGELGIVVEW